ncbi:phosphate transporter [Hyaloscypha finlandica]|nr:phosphate transporter [Hyaloscypha finlandica]
MGFLAGAYEIFAASLTLPMIEAVYYYPSKMSDSHEASLRCAILIGAALGQLSFGFLADLYGRRNMYGFELLIMIFAILGLATSSNGAENSMSVFGWLFFWRLVMGIGIGADYPLSATITSEFAPTAHRARMLATVFFMQPIGYLLAALVAMMVTAGYRDQIPDVLSAGTCDHSCIAAVDKAWRIIIAVGAAPALMAIYFRRTIPESPLYTAYVLNRIKEAKGDMSSLNPNASKPPSNANPSLFNTQAQIPQQEAPPVPVTAAGEDSEATEEAEKFSQKWRAYWRSFHRYFITNQHIGKLCGVSLSWLLLDCSFYAMNASSTNISSKLFDTIPVGGACTSRFQTNTTLIYGPVCAGVDPSIIGPRRQSIYGALFANTWRSLIVVSVGSLFGGSCMIYLIEKASPRRLQIWGFALLVPIFVAAGLFLRFLHGSANIPALIFYVLAQIFFDFGPNFTTFIIPAEMFPTRHRAFAHGIAAASGKMGASLFQLFIQFARFWTQGKRYGSGDPGTIWLGFTILCFLPTLVLGVIVSLFLVKETRAKDGTPRCLDVWEEESGVHNGHALQPTA